MGRGVGRQVAGVRLSVLGARGLKVVLPRAIPLSPIRCRPEFVGRPFAFWRLGVRGHPTGSAARSAGRTAEGGEWKEEGGKGGTVEDWKGGRREGWMGGREKAAWRGGGELARTAAGRRREGGGRGREAWMSRTGQTGRTSGPRPAVCAGGRAGWRGRAVRASGTGRTGGMGSAVRAGVGPDELDRATGRPTGRCGAAIRAREW
jgi:hypothetical protein